MQEHVHTGLTAFIFAGISAVVFINLIRLASAHMVANPGTEGLGRSLGALVSYPA